MPSRQFSTLLTVFRSRSKNDDPPLDRIRSDFDRFMAVMPAAEGVTRESVQVDGVEAEWLLAAGFEAGGSGSDESDDGTILFFHGGGFTSGSLASHRGLAARIALATGSRVLSVDYRLAPEHPFPAASEDCLRSYRWLLAQDVDPARLIVGGDSAGGGLALSTLQAIRDAGEPLPVAWFALSPWVDLTSEAASIWERAADDPILDLDGLRRVTDLYLDGVPKAHPQASPLFGDLDGLPPVLVQVGTAEMLYDDSTRLVERLQTGGCEAEIDVWDQMFHGWQLFGGMLPEAGEAIERLAEWINRQW